MRRFVIGALLLSGSAVYAQSNLSQQRRGQETQKLDQALTEPAPSAGTCGQIGGKADVTVENTTDGAVIRMKAKSPGQVTQVQQMAQRIETCMSSTATK